MTFYNIDDIDSFLEAVNDCKGAVELVTDNGDVLNLKSKLCSYVAMTRMVGAESRINELDIRFTDPEDEWRIFEHIAENKRKMA